MVRKAQTSGCTRPPTGQTDLYQPECEWHEDYMLLDAAISEAHAEIWPSIELDGEEAGTYILTEAVSRMAADITRLRETLKLIASHGGDRLAASNVARTALSNEVAP